MDASRVLIVPLFCVACLLLWAPGCDRMIGTAVAKCAAYTFATGVIGGDSNACTDGTAIEQAKSCDVKCGTGYVAQAGTVTCAAGAAQDAATTGGITSCVGGYPCVPSSRCILVTCMRFRNDLLNDFVGVTSDLATLVAITSLRLVSVVSGAVVKVVIMLIQPLLVVVAEQGY